MTIILVDPTLRRARIVRLTVAVFLVICAVLLVMCAVDLCGIGRPLSILDKPGRSSCRQPVYGSCSAAGQNVARDRRRDSTVRAAHSATIRRAKRAKVTVFVDPAMPGADESLRQHAAQITSMVEAGLLLDDYGGVIDRVDRNLLQTARDAGLPSLLLLQNIDEHDGRRRADRVHLLAQDSRSRGRLAQLLLNLCAADHLQGIHIDLLPHSDGWRDLEPIVTDLGRALRRNKLALQVDVPPGVDSDLLPALAQAADRIVILAFDEFDADGPPGPIASDAFVESSLHAAAAHVDATKLTAALTLGGYDWAGHDRGVPISFADARESAAVADVEPIWDASGNIRVQYSDAGYTHEIWLTDAVTISRQARIASAANIQSLALWQLGGEDPEVWEALRQIDRSSVDEVVVDVHDEQVAAALHLRANEPTRRVRREGRRPPSARHGRAADMLFRPPFPDDQPTPGQPSRPAKTADDDSLLKPPFQDQPRPRDLFKPPFGDQPDDRDLKPPFQDRPRGLDQFKPPFQNRRPDRRPDWDLFKPPFQDRRPDLDRFRPPFQERRRRDHDRSTAPVLVLPTPQPEVAAAATTPMPSRASEHFPGQVALAFEGGPSAEVTPLVLDLLQKEHLSATFFVTGSRALQHPEIIGREYREGHAIGNQTFTGRDINAMGERRLRAELDGTSQLLETIVGRWPILCRPRLPANAVARSRIRTMGYLIGSDRADVQLPVAPNSSELTQQALLQASNGRVIVLRDDGRDGSAVLQALPKILAQLRQRESKIVPLTNLLGKSRDDVMVPGSARRKPTTMLLRAAFAFAFAFRRALLLCLYFALALSAVRALVTTTLAVLAELRRRRIEASRPMPTVTALITTFNERNTIEQKIDSVLASSVPPEIVIVDDGSTDGTPQFLTARYGRAAHLHLVNQPRAGRVTALIAGLAACRTEVVVTIDGELELAPDTIRKLIEPLDDPAIAAVAGTVEIEGATSRLGRWQSLQLIMKQELSQRAWGFAAGSPIMSTTVTAWRRQALVDVEGFSSATFAEDTDLAMTLLRRGWRAIHVADARAYAQPVTSVRTLIEQHGVRCFGVLQALWKHRPGLGRREARFGRISWTAMLLGSVLGPVMTASALLAAVMLGWLGIVQPLICAGLLLLTIDFLQLVVAMFLAARSGGEIPLRLWLSVVTARALYRPLLALVALRAMVKLIHGVPLGMERLNKNKAVMACAAAIRALTQRG